MRVAPITVLHVPADVFVTDIHPAREADRAIGDHDLAVVAKIDRPALAETGAGQSAGDGDAGIEHRSQESPPQKPRPDSVEQKADLHPFGRLADQKVAQAIPRPVAPKDIVLEMDRLLCRPDCLFNQSQRSVRIRQDLDQVPEAAFGGAHAIGQAQQPLHLRFECLSGKKLKPCQPGYDPPDLLPRRQLQRGPSLDTVNSEQKEQEASRVGKRHDGCDPRQRRDRLLPLLKEGVGDQEQRHQVAAHNQRR
jgi:hypothetical protein